MPTLASLEQRQKNTAKTEDLNLKKQSYKIKVSRFQLKTIQPTKKQDPRLNEKRPQKDRDVRII